MKKLEYQKPTMKGIAADFEEPILTGSPNSLTTTGLGDDDNLELANDDDSQDTWGGAW